MCNCGQVRNQPVPIQEPEPQPQPEPVNEERIPVSVGQESS